MDRPSSTIAGPEFGTMVKALLPDVAKIFKSEQGKVVLYPASGTGAWEAALVNTLAPGTVSLFNNGHFSTLFAEAARNLGIDVDEVPLRWGQGVSGKHGRRENCAATVAARNAYKAVLVVHNETSTGVTSDVQAVRQALDATNHEAPADRRHRQLARQHRLSGWTSGAFDVTLTGSQKGLMLPPGMALLCVGPKAIAVSQSGAAGAASGTGTASSPTTRHGFLSVTPGYTAAVWAA